MIQYQSVISTLCGLFTYFTADHKSVKNINYKDINYLGHKEKNHAFSILIFGVHVFEQPK